MAWPVSKVMPSGEPHQPLALPVGGVEVDRSVGPVSRSVGMRGDEQLEQLVDAVHGQLGVDATAGAVTAVHGRLLRHPPGEEGARLGPAQVGHVAATSMP